MRCGVCPAGGMENGRRASLRPHLDRIGFRHILVHMTPEHRAIRIEPLDPAWVEVLRRKTPAERIMMALDANRMARLRIAGQLETDHPDWTPEQIQAEVARRMLYGTS